jgi:hypothetical protein
LQVFREGKSMVTRENSPGIYLILFFAFATMGTICCTAEGSAPQDLPGTWDVSAELVAATAENPYDPNAPKPGMIKPDVWAIQNQDGGPVLTGSSGSIQGKYTDGGAYFDGTYPLGSGVYMVVHIECYLDSSASMYGTNENDYWGTNTVTGEMIKLGIESWKFRAARR